MNLRTFALLACIVLPHFTFAATPVLGAIEAPVAGVVYGKVIRTQDAGELRYYVLRHLTDRYATQKGITVTQAEMNRYLKHLESFMQQDERRRSERLVELKRLLQGSALTTVQREAMTSELKTLELLGASSRGRDTESAQELAAREQIAKIFIRQWKLNRALYQQYGGRVVFQQGGPEPLDAYRKFLERSRASGEFIITDKLLDAEFWRYYRDDSMHTFLKPGSKEAQSAFAAPPWSTH
jgi:hypothetical protein